MYINKKEKHWLEVIIQERLNRMEYNIAKIEDEDEKIDAIKYASYERDTLENLYNKLYQHY